MIGLYQKIRLTFGYLASRLYTMILGPYVKLVVADTKQGTFAVDPRDFGVARHLLWNGKYSDVELSRIEEHIANDSRVLIVGAHVGAIVVPIAKLCKSLVCFEANPSTYEILNLNLYLNGIENCQAHCLAVGERRGEIEFLANSVNSGGSKRMPQKQTYAYTYDSPKSIRVQMVSLDEFLEDCHFDFVLMDIEGSEYFALKGMQKILSKARILQVEFVPHHLQNVSGVSTAEFVDQIAQHFSRLYIPTKKLWLGREEFASALEGMSQENKNDPGILFFKHCE